jgi:SAM-dependent methyltransferase
MDTELIDCPICAGKNLKTEFITKDFRYPALGVTFTIVRCSLCNFKFLNPRPTQNSSGEFYKSGFYKPGNSICYTIIRPLANLVKRNLVSTIKKYRSNGRVLDIGCGNGEFISLLMRNGFDAYGVEPSSQAPNYFLSSASGRIYNKNLGDCKFEDNYFDCIIMWQSLEHIHSLVDTLREIKRIIKPGGLMLVSVPNDNFFESKIFGTYYYNLEVPRHLYFFTRHSLTSLFKKNGYGDIKFKKNPFLELVCTPASFFYGVTYFLADKRIIGKKVLMNVLYFPLIILRLILRSIFIFDEQNLNIVAKVC